jgi:hypothetical protein
MPIYERMVDLKEAALGDEIVALDVDGGTCFGFNTVASSVWRALAEPRSFEALRDGLIEEYEVGRDQCEAELATLLTDLAARGLIRPVAL